MKLILRGLIASPALAELKYLHWSSIKTEARETMENLNSYGEVQVLLTETEQ